MTSSIALNHEICQPCSSASSVVTIEESTALLSSLPHWEIRSVNQILQLTRSYTFKNFIEAMQFTNRVAAIAEAQNHHPAIVTEWGKVSVSWWTHTLKGLHRNDFIMAARTDDCVLRSV